MASGLAAVARAFDRVAADYDATFGANPVGLLFRHTVQQRLLRLLPAGGRILELGCGTGDDALVLVSASSSSGLAVHATDVSPAMIAQARAKAEARGIPEERLRFEVRAAEDVADAGAGFDGAYSSFGALNCADLAAVGNGLARVLRPGAPVLLCLMGRWPLPAMLERGLLGRGEARSRSRPRVGGIEVPTAYPAPGEIRRRLGPGFGWRRQFALGLFVPGPEHAGWAVRHPQAFGMLASLEAVFRSRPILRSLGDHVVYEGVRR
jgi:SAM-dependent methyltransferase